MVKMTTPNISPVKIDSIGLLGIRLDIAFGMFSMKFVCSEEDTGLSPLFGTHLVNIYIVQASK